MDPPTYTAFVADGERESVPSVAPPSNAQEQCRASSSAVSLLLAPLEGRSTFLSGRLLPPPAGLHDVPPGTVFWDARGGTTSLGTTRQAAEVSGEVMTKNAPADRVEQLTVSLRLARRSGRKAADEVLFERTVVVYPPPSPSTSLGTEDATQRPSSSLDAELEASTRPRPPFPGPRLPFALPIPSSLPQCLHQPSLALAYTLSATLTLLPLPSSSPSTSSPLPPEAITERMEIHLCPSGRPTSQTTPLIRTVSAPRRTPTPVLVGFPKTRCRKSEPIRLWVEIPIPDQADLERGVGLRNVRAELWRVITVSSAASASSSSSLSSVRTEKGLAPLSSIPPSKVPSSPAGLADGSSSTSTLLTTTGSSCRFSPLSPIRLRLSVHAPLSPSSAYQLTCGHLTQRVETATETVDIGFWVKVMVGFVGAGVEEVECEQEVIVLGDLDDAEGLVQMPQSAVAEAPSAPGTPSAARTPPVEEDRPFTKEKIFEGETYRQSDDVGPSSSTSTTYVHPPGFVEALPSFSAEPPLEATSHSLALANAPPPFSEFPASGSGGAGGVDGPPSPSSRPPPFTAMATSAPDPSPPPPTFLESVPQPAQAPHPPTLAPASPPSPSYPLAPFGNLPPQVAPSTSPSADPANLPADWLEVDGYEIFSLPPPPITVGLETEGSVDPPEDGDAPGVDRGRLEQIYDSISPAALRTATATTISSGPSSRAGSIVAMTREPSRVDDPNDLPPTFRDLAIASSPLAGPSLALDPPPPHFEQFAHDPPPPPPPLLLAQAAGEGLPPHPSEVRSEQRRATREQRAEVVPPPYAGSGMEAAGGVTRMDEADEGGEQPPRYS